MPLRPSATGEIVRLSRPNFLGDNATTAGICIALEATSARMRPCTAVTTPGSVMEEAVGCATIALVSALSIAAKPGSVSRDSRTICRCADGSMKKYAP